MLRLSLYQEPRAGLGQEEQGTELGDCFSHLFRHKETAVLKGREVKQKWNVLCN